ncbi:MAG: DUF1684 domain-containing protein [Pyrinomonadaceae bacterium]
MRHFLLTLTVLIFWAVVVPAQTFYGTDDVKAFREGRDREFRNRNESPLKKEDFDEFRGLNYFPPDEGFRVSAGFRRTEDELYFLMPTSSGKLKKFIKYGILDFKLEGRQFFLNVYQIDPRIREKYPEYADLLFIPFKDRTNGAETYGGGRYLDIRIPKGAEEVKLDFNLAYNPNCAYGSDRYNCPIPPKENFLKTEIRAGEKAFPPAEAKAEH